MSTVKEKAELEAAIAEHELSDEQAAALKGAIGEGVPLEEALAALVAPEPELEHVGAGYSSAEEESGEPDAWRLEELQGAMTAHAADVQRIMGPFVAGWDTCSHCGGMAVAPPEPELLENERFRRCPVCNGHAKVKTGSLAEQYALADCPGCGGRGFQERTDLPSNGAVQAPPPAVLPALSPQPASGDNGAAEPQWGTPTWMGDTSIGTP